VHDKNSKQADTAAPAELRFHNAYTEFPGDACREDEALALKKLHDHKARGDTGKQAHAAALAEAAELRRKADLANKGLEPHAA